VLLTKEDQLIGAIRRAFAESGTTRLSSKQLAEALSELPNSSIHPSSNPQLTAVGLSRRLRQLGVKSKVLRFGDDLAKGYDLADFPDPPNTHT